MSTLESRWRQPDRPGPINPSDDRPIDPLPRVIEALEGRARFTAPLAARGAAVVGVILDLAVFFAAHVFWPDGLQGTFDGVAAAIGLAAGIALFRLRVR